MTPKELEKQNKLQELWDYIRGHIDEELWDKINEAVDLELELEAKRGK